MLLGPSDGKRFHQSGQRRHPGLPLVEDISTTSGASSVSWRSLPRYPRSNLSAVAISLIDACRPSSSICWYRNARANAFTSAGSAQQCAAEGADHLRYLLRLAELELIEREGRMVERRIREAHFPTVKSLDSFDFLAIPSLNKAMVLDLARGDYIGRRENVIALGNSGTGKTPVALGLGLAACQRGMSVGFTTAAALVHELLEARDEKRLLRLQKQLALGSAHGPPGRGGRVRGHAIGAGLLDVGTCPCPVPLYCGSA